MKLHCSLPRLLFTAITALAISSTGCKSNPPAQPAPVAGQTPEPAAPVTSNATSANQQQTAPARATYPTPAPVRRERVQPAPAVAPVPAPRPVALVVPSGTGIVVRINETLSASRNEVGDRFSGSLEEPILAGESTVFPRGTQVSGTVIAAKGRGRFKGEGAIGIEVTSIGSVRVRTSEYEQASKGKGKRTGTLIGGGAGLGALIGGLAGGGKGAVIGGLAGAGAGTAGAAYTGNKDVVIPSESVITFSLLEPLSR